MRAAALALLASLAFAAPASAQVIYSSLPLTGAAAAETRDALDGERMALAESGAPITLRSLDDATRQAGNWDPATVARNARRAARDPATIAYLGEFNSGASAISIPILNEAGIPQISPANSYPGLTRGGPGTERGEPDKYYPTGRRTYVRIAPADQLQAAAIAALLAKEGARSVAIAHDGEVYGHGIATMVAAAAGARGIRVTLVARMRGRRRDVARVARRVAASRPAAFFFGGVTANGCPDIARAVHRRLRRIPIVTADGCADFARRLDAGTAKRTLMTISAAPAASYGAAGADFERRFRARYRRSPAGYGAFGYETMALALDAINRAGGPSPDHRAAIVQALFATRDRDSVLGRYSIDPYGDTTLTTYGVFRVRARRLAFAFAIDSAAG